MRDLEHKLREWRTAFIESPLYSDSDILELESHLLEAVDRAVSTGATPEDAFQEAVRRVGAEPDVRPTFEDARRSEWLWMRWLKSIKPELRCFSSTAGRGIYGVLRIYSIGFGLFAALWLVAAVISTISHPSFHDLDPERYFYLQGVWLHYSIAVSSAFNLLAFRARPSRTEYVYRGLFIAWVVFILAFDLSQLGNAANRGGSFDAFFWDFNLAIGPLLWLTIRVKKPESLLVTGPTIRRVAL